MGGDRLSESIIEYFFRKPVQGAFIYAAQIHGWKPAH